MDMILNFKKWPKLFLRFIDDGFGFMEGTKQDVVKYWINQFNGLRKTINIDKWIFGNHVEYMDLCIYIYIYTQRSFLFWIFEFSKKKYTGICIFLKKAVMLLMPLKTTC